MTRPMQSPVAGSPRSVARLLAQVGATAALWAQSPAPLWSLQSPVRPPVPAVVDQAWVRQPIDAFVLQRLEQEGLRPAPEASRETLLRRLSLDLTGLPPTPSEVAAFVADAAPDAYERLVDRLLAEPHYGERMAQHWLDLARYADTNGHGGDSPRQMWAYRDWVIAAFQADQPFAQFTLEQIAGDLLPNATLAQRIATGFQRNHAVADLTLGVPGEYEHQYAADRTATFATTWLGLTVGCAECHDHKFDPISQRDYYGLYAFFDRLDEPGVAFNGPDTPMPRLQLPNAEQGAELLRLQARRAVLQEQLQVRARAAAAVRADWRQTLVQTRWAPLADLVAEFELEADGAAAAVAGIGKVTFEPAVLGSGARLDGNSGFLRAGAVAAFGADQAFSLSAWVRPEAGYLTFERAIVAKVDEAQQGRGYALQLVDGKPSLGLTGGKGDSVELRARDAVPTDRWTHVVATYDGSRKVEGLRLYVDGVPAAMPEAPPVPPTVGKPKPSLVGEFVPTAELRLGGLDGAPFLGGIDAVRIHGRALSDAEVLQLVRRDLAAVALQPTGERELVDAWFLAHEDAAGSALARELRELDHEHRTLLAKVPMVSVMEDSASAPPTRLLARGDFTQPRDVVEPAIPAVFGSLPPDAPRNRLGLARWLVDPDHPLLWRVAANRLWRLCFGRGLVETLDDFGTRGEAPSHPELLDWLAREFAEGGGSHQRLLKLLVTSATYRQSSHVDAEQLQRDPDNRLLARAGRWRLDAEALRDQALAVGGLLDRRIAGPSVRPWQAEDLWPEVSPPTDRHRRSLYVEANRSTPFLAMVLFDAPTREVCVARRDQTTTPLQALALLNDPNFHAAAVGLAQQLLADGAVRDDAARLVEGFRRCTARTPTDAELHVLQTLLRRQRGRCLGDEWTVWTAVAAVLLNLEETLSRS